LGLFFWSKDAPELGRSNAVLGAAIGDLQLGQLFKVELRRGLLA
jgi:hypothetical protein